MIKCCVCSKEAKWERVTQFAGEHPYCEEHASLEADFKDEDSYFFWRKIDSYFFWREIQMEDDETATSS